MDILVCILLAWAATALLLAIVIGLSIKLADASGHPAFDQAPAAIRDAEAALARGELPAMRGTGKAVCPDYVPTEFYA